ncbi:hypothetical protein ASE85_17120 [Sphingobium sp. Leaf26]|uniref:hypothetical protein n=1 Tax=Sphingobium sp. Leaf26 TaxID=1735693 RepID=UPI0006F24FD0|nr:hypothetical protein [Sphingobium sp. Leaf26]KQN08645.1 hypothetical protein ASE85_17120 [Sphingobium sp. Leaf26]
MSHLALRWTLLTMVRTQEKRFATWSEFEGLGTDEPLWRIPPDRMKMRTEHVVLSARLGRQSKGACDLLTTSSTPYTAAWYRKTSLTFSDAIGAIRLQLWVGDINLHSPPHREPHYIPTT